MFNFGPIPVNIVPGTATLTLREDTGAGPSGPADASMVFEVAGHLRPVRLSRCALQRHARRDGAAGLDAQGRGQPDPGLQRPQHLPNPPNPFTSQRAGQQHHLHPDGAGLVNGATGDGRSANPPSRSRRRASSALYARYGIVYRGQGETLHWTTQQADSCVLKANGVVIDAQAPVSTGPAGYPIDARVMQSTTTFGA